ncbi:MAG TPA: Gfo/Idh/MocA family oxidoreductase [Verrucomicrobiae bacterium]|nr:Gfo/Idh/MocA family oxidoreductase [Verrucomicrobiae bacterium]
MKALMVSLLLCLAATGVRSEEARPPVRLVVIGLAHDAVGDFIQRARARQDVQLVGIVETNREMTARYAGLFNLSTNFFYPSLDALLAKTNAQAAAVFTSTFDHRAVAEACALHGMDVMFEKPLAVDMDQARAIAAAAKKGGIQVIVNYETAWYQANQTAYTISHEQHAIGDLRKIVVCAGNKGPKETGCSDEFLDWLTDPGLAGGGALIDFGCYGVDLATWFVNGQRPVSVVAMAQHIKPEVYPKVEDEATIILAYPQTQAIIQASWNWPFDRRDLAVYGRTGYILVPQRDLLRTRLTGTEESELDLPDPPIPSPASDDISYFIAVVRGEIQPSGQPSLEINMIVTEILDAARESAATGKRVELPQDHPW